MRAWSIIVALETCLCPKSYLCGSQIRRRQIGRHVWRVGGDGAGDPAREPFVNGPRRVSPDVGTEDGGTRSIARGRHMW